MRVLVTGAGGYVGRRLVPVLLEWGHEVTASFTDVGSAARFPWADRVTAVSMDALEAGQVQAATRGMDAVFYLVHGMAGPDFVDTDERAAHHLAHAAIDNEVGRIVYLSGIVPPAEDDALSPHLRSRFEVERILSASGVPTIAVRAAVVLGSGSTSFEIVRQISERMPVHAVPVWMTSRVQPIAVVDAIEVLARCLDVPAVTRSYDIGGPEQLRYVDLLGLYAEVAGLVRPRVTLPLVPAEVVGWAAGRITDVPAPVVEALVQSLRHDMVCSEEDFRVELLPVGYRLLGMREAITRALADPTRPSGPVDHPDPEPVDPDDLDPAVLDPMGPLPTDPEWAGGEVYVTDGRPVHAPRTPVAELLLGRKRRDQPVVDERPA